MNDFTKEELMDLEFAVISVYMGNSELRGKIQSMIDNYRDCKHDGEIGIDYPALKCMKCDACLGW